MGFCTTDAKFDVRTIPESWIFLQDVPKFPFGANYTQVNDVAEVFRTRPCAMLSNDSVIVASDSLINAFDRLEVAEFSAKSLILAAPVGKLHPITDAEVEDLRVAFHVGE
jgi:L-fuculose-phosphate aldolase